MTRLTVAHTKLTHIPEYIKHLPNLTSLNVSSNKIKEVTNVFESLGALKELTLDWNHIEKVDKGILSSFPSTSLTSLSLCGNQLTEIPEDICALVGLESLNLSFNFIEKVPESLFKSLLKLKTLNLSFNDVMELPGTFCLCTSLTSLSLLDNQVIIFEIIYTFYLLIILIYSSLRPFYSLTQQKQSLIKKNTITTTNPSPRSKNSPPISQN